MLTNNNDTNNKWINVVISRKTHDDLKTLGDATQSFNDIIEMLISEKKPMIQAIRAAKGK